MGVRGDAEPHPDEPDAHDDHPDSTVLMVHAYDEYNRDSGIVDYYKDAGTATTEVDLHNVVEITQHGING